MVLTAVGKIPWPESLSGWSYLGILGLNLNLTKILWFRCKNDMSQHQTDAKKLHAREIDWCIVAIPVWLLQRCSFYATVWCQNCHGWRQCQPSDPGVLIKTHTKLMTSATNHTYITYLTYIYIHFLVNFKRLTQVSKSRTLPGSWPGNNVVKESNGRSPANSVACHEQRLTCSAV